MQPEDVIHEQKSWDSKSVEPLLKNKLEKTQSLFFKISLVQFLLVQQSTDEVPCSALSNAHTSPGLKDHHKSQQVPLEEALELESWC